MSTQENQAPVNQVQDEVQLYFFHSTPEKQKTFRQYSTGGYVSRALDNNVPYATLAYAVCSERDTFSKEKARLITSGRLVKGEKVHRIAITEEQFAHPARTIRDMAIKYVPASTLPKERHANFVKRYNESADPTHQGITAAQILIQIPTEEELLSIETSYQTELQCAINLANLLTPNQAVQA